MKIYTFGEILIDLIANGQNSNSFTKFAGGAPANVAVAIKRLGGNVAFISKVGNDAFGEFLKDTLVKESIDLTHFETCNSSKTAVAIVSIDKNGERSFDFYKDKAAHESFQHQDQIEIELNDPAILHICSNSFATEDLEYYTKRLIKKFKDNNSIVSFDINYRKDFWNAPSQASLKIIELSAQCDIVKASKDELMELFGADDSTKYCETILNAGCQLIIITDGEKNIRYVSKLFDIHIPTPNVKAIDTTAAGDSFIGGVLYSIAKRCSNREAFKAYFSELSNIESTLNFGSKCGAITVTKKGAIDSLPKLDEVV